MSRASSQAARMIVSPGYMVDTNVFDALAKGRLSLLNFDFSPLFATAIQQRELAATPDDALKSSLLQTFIELKAENLSTSIGVWDMSGWDEAKWGTEEQSAFTQRFAATLLEADKRSRKNPGNPQKNAMHDALIAVTARDHGLVLLTGDKNLHDLAQHTGISSKLIRWW